MKDQIPDRTPAAVDEADLEGLADARMVLWQRAEARRLAERAWIDAFGPATTTTPTSTNGKMIAFVAGRSGSRRAGQIAPSGRSR